MARSGGRPQALRTAATRLTVIEKVLETGSIREAAEAIGAHERSIQRYARANAWFDKILTAAIARADRKELLGSLEEWARFEAGETSEPPPMFEALLPLGPPRPPRPSATPLAEPDPAPADPSVLPDSYLPRAPVPSAGEATTAEAVPSEAPPVLVVGIELVGRTAAEFLGVDQDLVDDANKDLARVGLPSVEDISVMAVRIANDRTHPACAIFCRELFRVGGAELQKAQARRFLNEMRREQQGRPVLDAEATEVPPPLATGARPVFIRLPRNGTEAPGRGPVSTPDSK